MVTMLKAFFPKLFDARVTRLVIVTLGFFNPLFVLPFPQLRYVGNALILTKMHCTTFWAIFSQNHLVTQRK
jgi:hypothetical protein